MTGLVPKFKRHFLIVGAAAFQDEWLRSVSIDTSIGFGGGDKCEESREIVFERLVRTQHLVPEELLYRFNDRLVVIAPPTVDEFSERIQSIRNFLSLPPLRESELASLGHAAATSGKMMRWLEGYLSGCLAEVSADSLLSLTTAAEESVNSGPENEFAPSTSPPRVINTKWRDLAFDAYESALHDLSRSATRMCALCDSVVTGVSFPFYTTLQEKLYEGMKLGGQNLSPNKSPLESIELYGRYLRFIAYHAVRLALPSVPAKERAEQAGKIQRVSYRLSRAFQMMTSQCNDYSEGRPFFDGSSEFIFCAENASARLDHLRTFDSPPLRG